MPWRISSIALVRAFATLLLLVSLAYAVMAQSPAKVNLGDSVVTLTGPWKFHPGDNLAWASPTIDDSAWATLDLTPPPGSFDPVQGSSGFVPGWTTNGYPNLTGYAWYRLTIDLRKNGGSLSGSDLAIKLPQNVDDAYQVYANGQLIGEFGRFTANRITFYNAQPRAFPLPSSFREGPVTIAIRMWMDTGTPLVSPDAGGLHGTPLIGLSPSIEAMLRMDWDDIARAEIGNFLVVIVLLLTAFLGITLYWLDPRDPAYLWLGAAAAPALLSRAMVVEGYYSTWLPMTTETFLTDAIFGPLLLSLWTIFWVYWFGLDRPERIKRIVWSVAAALALVIASIRPPIYGAVVPVSAAAWLLPLSIALKLLLGVVFLWVTWHGIRKQGIEGWITLPVVLSAIMCLYAEELSLAHIRSTIFIAGLRLNIIQIGNLLTFSIVSILLIRRFIRRQRERELWRHELEQAREVQQFLIPEALPTIPGFTVESEYRPAQQVGGDFFQILPVNKGGVLVVIGDVSGKGMPAAMTVSQLVGTVLTLAQYTTSPREILESMNARMLTRSGGGFTTCLVLRADADGTVTIANAGHLSPYINGKEAATETGLPLGISAQSRYPETIAQLSENAQLTLITDGVIEARSKTGELFSFDRTASIATDSAEAIALTAQRFGQDDDITVVTLTRQPTPVPAAYALA
jgi:Stage II sporulation protein E (SpoIIE)